MSRREEAAQHVRDGISPSKIAAKMGVSGSTIRPYLLQQIAEGHLRRFDIVRSIDEKTKRRYDEFIEIHESDGYWPLVNAGRASGFDMDEFRLYLECRNSLRGELYTYIAKVEVFLHDKIRKSLVAEFGGDEMEWWRNGIPEQIRLSCVSIRETDPYPPGEPYAYTTFIHLSKIIDKNWQIFHFIVPQEYASDKKALARTFDRLNAIRNAVMHPVKHFAFSDDDFQFVAETADLLGNPQKWRG